MKFTLLHQIITNPTNLMLLVPGTAVASTIVNLKSVVFILIYLFIGDLITGVLASYFDWKKSAHKDSWFFGKGEGFSSDKFKKCFVKLFIYAGVPWIIYQFQITFLIKNIKYKYVTDSEIEITSAFLLIFCAVELFSIIHENLPRCGFNLWKIIKSMIGFYKEVKNEI